MLQPIIVCTIIIVKKLLNKLLLSVMKKKLLLLLSIPFFTIISCEKEKKPTMSYNLLIEKLENGLVKGLTVLNEKEIKAVFIEDKETDIEQTYFIKLSNRTFQQFAEDVENAQKNIPINNRVYIVHETRRSIF